MKTKQKPQKSTPATDTIFARHGDVLLDPTTETVKGLKRAPASKRGGVVLQQGNATGHAHRVRGDATLYVGDGANPKRILVVRAASKLTHEEHGTIKLPPGRYSVRIKRAYTPERWVDVTD